MDFSQYGNPSYEWKAYTAAHPEAEAPRRLPAGCTPKEFQSQTNTSRETAANSAFSANNLESAVDIVDHQIPGRDGYMIPARSYHPKNVTASESQKLPGFIYYHGGGFLFGNVDTERLTCASIAAKLHIVVIHICYRHTPDFTFPKAHEDGIDGLKWSALNAKALGIDEKRLVVGGFSAGGSVAVAATATVSGILDEPKSVQVQALALGLPMLIQPEAFPYDLFASKEVTSPVQCAEAPVLCKEMLHLFSSLMAVDNPHDPLINAPLLSDDQLRKLPRTALIVAGRDPLRDGSLILASRLQQLR